MPGQDVPRQPEPAARSKCSATARSSRASPRPRPARGFSSSASATSPSTPSRARARSTFNRIVSLRDTWARIAQKAEQLMEYHITQYDLEQGALEIQYIEEFFGEFPRKKTAAEIVRRLTGRDASHPARERAARATTAGTVVPVSFKVAHEIQSPETEPKLHDLVDRLRDHVAVRRPEGALHVDRRHAGATGAARATSARSPSSRKSGPSSRVSTRSSSRRRTGSTRCAARSITCASKS